MDYRALNRVTKRNISPLPRCDEMFDSLGNARIFSKLDLKTGFHQIRVKEKDVEKTAFNTKYGQFEYLVMPMGLCNAPATFQSLMNSIFTDYIDDFMVIYMDDLLVYSKSVEDHMIHVRQVLQRLRENHLYVSPRKCDFMKSEIEFLGMIVGHNEIKVDDREIEAIREWPKPKTITDVRSFLRLAQFFRRFVPEFSSIAYPLTNLTKKNNSISNRDAECQHAFQELKLALINPPVLRSFFWIGRSHSLAM